MTSDEIKEYLEYNPDTGVFTWIHLPKYSKKRVGDIAGCDMKGYVGIWFKGKLWKAHILAWIYMTNEQPINYIDHVNGVPSDNRFINLREATNAENQWNVGLNASNTSGIKGVTYHKRDKLWQVVFKYKGQQYFVGSFKDKEFAELVASEVRSKYYGEFYRES